MLTPLKAVMLTPLKADMLTPLKADIRTRLKAALVLIALFNGVVVDEVAGLEIVGGVEDQRGIGEQGMDVVGYEIGDVGVDLDVAVEACDLSPCGLCLRSGGGGIGLVKENLTLQVALLDEIAVDEDEGADTGSGKQCGRGRAGGTAADDGDCGAGEALLSFLTDGRKEDLA